MQDEQPGFFGHIARFIAGDTKRTAKSASTMNQIVDGLNALLAMQGTNGIRVVPAAAGFTIELDDTVKRELGMLPEIGASGEVTPAKGALHWRGDWDAKKTYYSNDIVVHRSVAAIGAGLNAGTYIANTDIPTSLTSTTTGVKAITGATNATPIVITSVAHGLSNGYIVTIAEVGGNTEANATWTIKSVTSDTFTLTSSVGNGAYTSGGYINKTTEPYEDVAANQLWWKTWSKGAWKKLVLGDIPGSTRGSVLIDVTQMNGKDLYVREVDICVAGVAKKMMVIGSEAYV